MGDLGAAFDVPRVIGADWPPESNIVPKGVYHAAREEPLLYERGRAGECLHPASRICIIRSKVFAFSVYTVHQLDILR